MENEMRCQVRVGFFLVRNCGEPAAGQCARCGGLACLSHAKRYTENQQEFLVCVECIRRQTRTYASHDTYYTSSTSSSSSSEQADSYGGGVSEGAGASRGWDDTATPAGSASETPADSPGPAASNLADNAVDQFSADDVAAFDEVSSFDRDTDTPDVYDS